MSLAAFPFAVGFALAPERELALLAFAPFYLLNNLYVASLWTLVQGLVAPGLRATASATQLAVTNVVGYGVGPTLVGFLNDALAPRFGDDAIRWSLLGAARRRRRERLLLLAVRPHPARGPGATRQNQLSVPAGLAR